MAEQEQLVGAVLKDRRAARSEHWESVAGGGRADVGYYIDTRPDRDNIAYGSLYRQDVAYFHRFGGSLSGGDRSANAPGGGGITARAWAKGVGISTEVRWRSGLNTSGRPPLRVESVRVSFPTG